MNIGQTIQDSRQEVNDEFEILKRKLQQKTSFLSKFAFSNKVTYNKFLRSFLSDTIYDGDIWVFPINPFKLGVYYNVHCFTASISEKILKL